jgi:hypothetical protein
MALLALIVLVITDLWALLTQLVAIQRRRALYSDKTINWFMVRLFLALTAISSLSQASHSEATQVMTVSLYITECIYLCATINRKRLVNYNTHHAALAITICIVQLFAGLVLYLTSS